MNELQKIRCLLALAVFVSVAIQPARADTLVLRTGEKLRGSVVAEQPSSVTFDSDGLGRIEVSRERILQLERDPANVTSVTGTNSAPPRDFLRFYNKDGIFYEFVEPLKVGIPFKASTNLTSENITVRGRIGFRASFDAAAYINSKGQQDVDSGVQLRTMRFYTAGEFGVLHTNQFKLDLGLSGGDFYINDAYLRRPDLPYIGNLTFGYFTVPQTLENIASFGVNTFMEAASPGLAFSPGHRIGIQIDRTYWNERVTASAGVFSVGQDASLDFGDASDSLARPTVRLTGLLIDKPEQHRLLHLGASASFVFSDSSEIRYQARPESHLAPVLVDTGKLPARFAYVGGLEAIFQQGPLTLQSEFIGSTVDTGNSDIFWGTYVYAAWLLTGEQRSYVRTAGAPGKVRPNSPFSFKHHGWGALELALRYSYLDLQDSSVNGGRMNILMPGLNWYWSEDVRWQFNYGFSHVEKGPSPGNLDIFQMRLQVDF